MVERDVIGVLLAADHHLEPIYRRRLPRLLSGGIALFRQRGKRFGVRTNRFSFPLRKQDWLSQNDVPRVQVSTHGDGAGQHSTEQLPMSVGRS